MREVTIHLISGKDIQYESSKSKDELKNFYNNSLQESDIITLNLEGSKFIVKIKNIEYVEIK